MGKFIDRTGEKRMMNCGLEATIIAYRGTSDIDIEFSDGSKRHSTPYRYFKDGTVLPKKKWSTNFNNRVGEKQIMNCGMEATIIAYRGTSDIDIEFSDGVIVSNRFYQCFKNGLIRYPIKSRLGEKRMMKCGMEATIIAYRNSHDIDIEFSDGSRRYGIRYKKFQEGVTLPEKKWVCGFNSRVGEKRMMNCGLEAEIIAYRCCSDIDIKFSDGTVRTRKAYDSFRKGTIAYPLIQRNYSGTLSSFTLEKLAYKHNDSVYYFCECQKCKLRDILTPQEILKHECEVINSE